MKKQSLYVLTVVLGMVFFCFSGPLRAKEDQTCAENNLLITKAVLVIEEFMMSPDKDPVASLMKKSVAVAIFPTSYKGAFFVGAQYGKGIMCAYNKEKGSWSAPAFFTLGAGSIGFQFGAEATDLVLVVVNKRGLESLLRQTVTLGGDIAVAAGPVGRKAQAETDITLNAAIYAYSRSKGVFAGLSLKGAVLSPDVAANSAQYGEHWKPKDILLDNKVQPRGIALELIHTLNRFIE